ncbi:hypothetical protein ACFVX3_19980 [Rhodococcus erythropolis]
MKVTAPEGYGQSERRAVRKAVGRAREWNAENDGVNVPRRPA